MGTETSNKSSFTGKHFWKRLLTLLLVAVMTVSSLPLNALAAWDGSGSASDGTAGNISEGCAISYSNTNAIIGYRFSVYAGATVDSLGITAGDKLGYSIDIDLYRSATAPRRSYGTNKKSHIDLNREYVEYLDGDDTPTLGALADDRTTSSRVYWYEDVEDYFAGKGITLEDGLTMLDTRSEPTKMSQWVTEETSQYIARYCGVSQAAFDADTAYIIVEPLFAIFLDGSVLHALTMAEMAVYQSNTVELARIEQGYAQNEIDGWTHTTPYSEYSIFIVRKIPKK